MESASLDALHVLVDIKNPLFLFTLLSLGKNCARGNARADRGLARGVSDTNHLNGI